MTYVCLVGIVFALLTRIMNFAILDFTGMMNFLINLGITMERCTDIHMKHKFTFDFVELKHLDHRSEQLAYMEEKAIENLKANGFTWEKGEVNFTLDDRDNEYVCEVGFKIYGFSLEGLR